MKIAIYTLTRDRLEYTQRSFESLRQKAGEAVFYQHFVVDNGSQDGTAEWLLQAPVLAGVKFLPENVGISAASNMALEMIFKADPGVDLVIKMDNDCLVQSENLLGQVVEIYQDCRDRSFGSKFVLSPKVNGIVRQPNRGRETQLAGRRIGLTAIVGGLFHIVPAFVYKQYRYPAELAYAHGQDDHFCGWVKRRGGEVGYIEGLEVEHMDGTDAQAKKYPAYFERKWREEKTVPPIEGVL